MAGFRAGHIVSNTHAIAVNQAWAGSPGTIFSTNRTHTGEAHCPFHCPFAAFHCRSLRCCRAWRSPSIAIERPTEGRGWCSRMTVPPAASHPGQRPQWLHHRPRVAGLVQTAARRRGGGLCGKPRQRSRPDHDRLRRHPGHRPTAAARRLRRRRHAAHMPHTAPSRPSLNPPCCGSDGAYFARSICGPRRHAVPWAGGPEGCHGRQEHRHGRRMLRRMLAGRRKLRGNLHPTPAAHMPPTCRRRRRRRHWAFPTQLPRPKPTADSLPARTALYLRCPA